MSAGLVSGSLGRPPRRNGDERYRRLGMDRATWGQAARADRCAAGGDIGGERRAYAATRAYRLRGWVYYIGRKAL